MNYNSYYETLGTIETALMIKTSKWFYYAELTLEETRQNNTGSAMERNTTCAEVTYMTV